MTRAELLAVAGALAIAPTLPACKSRRTVTLSRAAPVDIVMVPIPRGTFAMGTAKGSPDEQPVHDVTVRSSRWNGRSRP